MIFISCDQRENFRLIIDAAMQPQKEFVRSRWRSFAGCDDSTLDEIFHTVNFWIEMIEHDKGFVWTTIDFYQQ